MVGGEAKTRGPGLLPVAIPVLIREFRGAPYGVHPDRRHEWLSCACATADLRFLLPGLPGQSSLGPVPLVPLGLLNGLGERLGSGDGPAVRTHKAFPFRREAVEAFGKLGGPWRTPSGQTVSGPRTFRSLPLGVGDGSDLDAP